MEEIGSSVVEPEEFAQASGNTQPRRHLGDISVQEVDEHLLIHCPYRSRCNTCVQARGKEDPHAFAHERKEAIPRLSVVYKEVSEYVDETARKKTTLIIMDRDITVIVAYVVAAKGSSEQVKGIFEFVDPFGHDKISLKSDNGDAIKAVRDEMIHQGESQTVLACSVPYRPGTHGIAEKVAQDVAAQHRKCKVALEARLGCAIEVDTQMVGCMVERAAGILGCHLMVHGGPHPTRVEFGEPVMSKFSKSEKKSSRRSPLAKKVVLRIWIGTYEATSENIVAIEVGRSGREPFSGGQMKKDGMLKPWGAYVAFHPSQILNRRSQGFMRSKRKASKPMIVLHPRGWRA